MNWKERLGDIFGHVSEIGCMTVILVPFGFGVYLIVSEFVEKPNKLLDVAFTLVALIAFLSLLVGIRELKHFIEDRRDTKKCIEKTKKWIDDFFEEYKKRKLSGAPVETYERHDLERRIDKQKEKCYEWIERHNMQYYRTKYKHTIPSWRAEYYGKSVTHCSPLSISEVIIESVLGKREFRKYARNCYNFPWDNIRVKINIKK